MGHVGECESVRAAAGATDRRNSDRVAGPVGNSSSRAALMGLALCHAGLETARHRVDSALAFVLTVLYLPGAMDDEPTVVVVPLALAQTLPLAFRRVRPVAVLALTLASGIVFNVGFADSPTLPLGVVVSLYTVAAYCEGTVSTRAGLVTAVALPLAILVAAGFAVDSALLPLGITAGAWLLGDNLRTRRAYPASSRPRPCGSSASARGRRVARSRSSRRGSRASC